MLPKSLMRTGKAQKCRLRPGTRDLPTPSRTSRSLLGHLGRLGSTSTSGETINGAGKMHGEFGSRWTRRVCSFERAKILASWLVLPTSGWNFGILQVELPSSRLSKPIAILLRGALVARLLALPLRRFSVSSLLSYRVAPHRLFRRLRLHPLTLWFAASLLRRVLNKFWKTKRQ